MGEVLTSSKRTSYLQVTDCHSQVTVKNCQLEKKLDFACLFEILLITHLNYNSETFTAGLPQNLPEN